MATLAATVDRPIFILHEMGQVYSFNQEGSEPDLFIWYSNLQGHYEALEEQRRGEKPKDWIEQRPISHSHTSHQSLNAGKAANQLV